MEPSETTQSILATVSEVNACVGGDCAEQCSRAGTGGGLPRSTDQARGLAVQSVAQSAAIMVQDATNLFRNLSTIEATAIGVATANWIAQPDNVAYLLIIEESQRVLQNAASLVKAAGESAGSLITSFTQGSES